MHPLTMGDEYMKSYYGTQMPPPEGECNFKSEMADLELPAKCVLNHRYQILKVVGFGTFGKVWAAYDHLQQKEVAIKMMRLNESIYLDRELRINKFLSMLNYENECVLKYYDSFVCGKFFAIVIERAYHSILTFINYFDECVITPPLDLVKKIAYDILLGLKYLHSHGVIHADLKPENILADRPIFPYSKDVDAFHPLEDDPKSVTFKIIDFGNCSFVDDYNHQLIQTRDYRCPEVILGMDYTTAADIWSLGCIVYELVTTIQLFSPEPINYRPDNGSGFWIYDSLHLSMIEGVVGIIPPEWASKGDNYKNLVDEKGNWIYADEEKTMCIYEHLISSKIPHYYAAQITDFIEPMLSIIPETRPTVDDLLESPFLCMY